MRRFKLLQPILEFPAGSVYQLEGDYIHLGYGNGGWDIPLKIILKNPTWFEEVEEIK